MVADRAVATIRLEKTDRPMAHIARRASGATSEAMARPATIAEVIAVAIVVLGLMAALDVAMVVALVTKVRHAFRVRAVAATPRHRAAAQAEAMSAAIPAPHRAVARAAIARPHLAPAAHQALVVRALDQGIAR